MLKPAHHRRFQVYLMGTPVPDTTDADINSSVDASRPFHSVKEAVAIFGKRVLLREVQSPLQKPPSSSAIEKGMISPSSEFIPSSESPPDVAIEIGTLDSSECMHSPYEPISIATKEAVGSSVNEPTPSPEIPTNQNGIHPSRIHWHNGVSPSASTSSEEVEPTPAFENPNDKHGSIVHGNDLVMMLMILKRLGSELQETKMEVKLLKERESDTEVALASLNAELHKNMAKIAKAEAAEAGKAAAKSRALAGEGNREIAMKDDEKRSFEAMVKNVDSPTSAQILSISNYNCYFGDMKVKKKMKKKPIIPLVTDIFPWRKRSTPNRSLSTPIWQ